MIIRSEIFLVLYLFYTNVDCQTDHPLNKYFIKDYGENEKESKLYSPVHQEQILDWKQFVQLKQLEADIFWAMSKDIFYDFVVKMRSLTFLEEEYKKDENFELGVIAATVMEKFAHMTLIYKKAAEWDFWDVDDFGRTTNVITLYGIMLSDYNEIRIEKNLFYDIMKKTSQKKAEQKKIQAQGYSAQEAEMIQQMQEQGQPLTEQAVTQKNINQFTYKELMAMKEASETPEGIAMLSAGGPDGKNMDRLRGPQLPGRSSRKMGSSLANETVNQAHEEYKRSLRQRKWLQKWQRFNPEVEGISVSNRLSNIATNNSDFLGLNVF